MSIKFLKRSFFQRVLGTPATKEPGDAGCWEFGDGKITIVLETAPELLIPGGAVRLEGGSLPFRVLVVFGEDGKYRAYRNECTHIGHRRLDPVPGTDTVQCCSISRSTFNSAGEKIHGPAGRPIKSYPVEQDNNKLIVFISE